MLAANSSLLAESMTGSFKKHSNASGQIVNTKKEGKWMQVIFILSTLLYGG